MNITDRVIPTSQPADMPTHKILVDGSEIKTYYPIHSIYVTKCANKIASAQIIIYDGDAAEENFEISSTEDFIPGKEIEIKAGYYSDNSTIFKGIIVKHGIQVRRNKPSFLIVDCKDHAVKMTIGRKNGYYYESKDSEIIEEITGKYSLDSDIEPTDVTHKEMVQYSSTDWDFILSRAEVNGKLVYCSDGKITVKKPEISGSSVISLLYGATMLEFEGEIDIRRQFSSVKAYSWDSSSQEVTEIEASDPSIEEQGNLVSTDLADITGSEPYELKHPGGIADSELQAWADSKLMRSRLSKIIGRAKFQGFPDVAPGDTIEIGGVGDRFNGKAFAAAVKHQITPQNWETDIQFGIPEDYFIHRNKVNDIEAAGLLPGVKGLHIGTVTKLESDPDGEDRIQVKIPFINTNDDGIWARVSTLDAGSERGSFFRPEIDDEVILGFIGEDPRKPVVLGMVNSSSKPAPLKASDQNPEKGFVTREKIKFIFNDEKKSIEIETPGGHKISISDDQAAIEIQDSNNNKYKMSSEGISLESNAKISIKANSDVEIEGVNVQIKASAEFKAEGSSGAKIESSGIAELKGSLVKIN
jgi:Rhs element Vgr protein